MAMLVSAVSCTCAAIKVQLLAHAILHIMYRLLQQVAVDAVAGIAIPCKKCTSRHYANKHLANPALQWLQECCTVYLCYLLQSYAVVMSSHA